MGRIDLLVLAAGVSAHSMFDDLPLDIFDKVMKINLYGYVYLTKYALPYLYKTEGQILIISSISGSIPLPMRTHYCASKYAVTGFFCSLRHEVADRGVSITIAYPPTVTGTGFR